VEIISININVLKQPPDVESSLERETVAYKPPQASRLEVFYWKDFKMDFIEEIKRVDSVVEIRINSGINIDKSVFIFRLDLENDAFAELLTDKLQDELDHAVIDEWLSVAKFPEEYLSTESLIQLKKKLRKFNIKTEEWDG